MEVTKIGERVRELVAECAGLPVERLKNDVKLKAYDVDSARAYELLVLLEDAFDVKIPSSSLDKMQTIDDVVSEIERLSAKADSR